MLKYDRKSPTLSLVRGILCFSVVVCGTAAAVYLLWRTHWLAALVAAVPVWILLTDLFVNRRKSVIWYFLDFVRHIIVFAGTGMSVWFIWKIHWILCVVTAVPIFVLLLNLVGFLTLPLYWSDLTPEGRAARKAGRKLDELKGKMDELEPDSKQ